MIHATSVTRARPFFFSETVGLRDILSLDKIPEGDICPPSSSWIEKHSGNSKKKAEASELFKKKRSRNRRGRRKAGEQVSVAIASGGLAGTVRLKLGAPVTSIGQELKLISGPGGCLFGPATGGERIVMAQALETGVADEKIEAVIFRPQYYAS
jgi:hypothetical protein